MRLLRCVSSLQQHSIINGLVFHRLYSDLRFLFQQLICLSGRKMASFTHEDVGFVAVFTLKHVLNVITKELLIALRECICPVVRTLYHYSIYLYFSHLLQGLK